MNSYFPNLFTPMKLGGHVFRNRLLVAPHWIDNSFRRGNELAPELLDYYEERAKGGFALVSAGDFPVNYENAGYPSEGRFHFYENMDRRSELAMEDLVRRIHRHGALAEAELTHWGVKIAEPHQGFVIGPMEYTRPDGVLCKGMDEAMMNAIADDFAKCAVRAKALGFDAVMIHGGHGWLLSQFLSPRDNKRTDQYGGSAENRGRFPQMVCQRVRDAVGPNMIIEFRMSWVEDNYAYAPYLRNMPDVNSFMAFETYDEPGMQLEDTLVFSRMIDGIVDIIHISAGNHTDLTFDPTRLPPMLNLDAAAAVKREVKQSKVTVVGGWNDPEACEAAIASGKVDFISMARQAIADPYFPQKAQQGKAYEINSCIRCGNCVNCTVNPIPFGHEHDVGVLLTPAKEPKKVVVVGGGPGGMKAAETAAKRGFQVVLFEKEQALGGKMRLTELDALKGDIFKYITRMRKRLETYENVDIRLGTTATPEMVNAEAPDAVIAAIGSKFNIPAIPGLENLPHCNVEEAFYKLDQLGTNIVVVGGGESGCDAAIDFASKGKHVTLLSRSKVICKNLDPVMGDSERAGKIADFTKYGGTLYTACACTEVNERGVFGSNGVFVEADAVVFASGETDTLDEAECFRGDGYFRAIGDCRAPGLMGSAIYEGYYAALDI